MADANPTAYDLFQRFAPKFRTVTWKPAGFRIRGVVSKREMHRFDFFPADMQNVTLYAYHGIDISSTGANLDFTFRFDPKSEADMTTQVLHACWDAVLEGPFKGRTFYADPSKDQIQLQFERLACVGRGGDLRINFSYDGDAIPGLELVPTMKASDWSYFIPIDSAEGRAVEAAVKLQRGLYRQTYKEEQPPDIATLTATLEQALQAAA